MQHARSTLSLRDDSGNDFFCRPAEEPLDYVRHHPSAMREDEFDVRILRGRAVLDHAANRSRRVRAVFDQRLRYASSKISAASRFGRMGIHNETSAIHFFPNRVED